jgi:hypothetical protein
VKIVQKEIEVPRWNEVVEFIKTRFDRPATDVKEILFVVGLREYGQKKKKFTKEQKQDLMNLAACKSLSLAGFFEVSHLDAEGWPVWKQVKPIPQMDARHQEAFIKENLVHYFESEGLL